MIETELLHHGYLFVFLGTIFEEVSTLLTSTFLAHRGYLHFSWVLIIAAMSRVAANEAYLLIGRRTGVKWLDTASAGSRKIETVITWSHQHGALLVVASRFMPGFRTLIPIVTSATKMDAVRFLAWNAVGAFCWAITFGLAGYLGGQLFAILLRDIHRYEKTVATVLALGSAGLILWKTRGRDLRDVRLLRKA